MSWYLHVVYLLSFVAMTMLMINICWTENNSNSFFNNLDYPNQSYRTAKEHHNTERMGESPNSTNQREMSTTALKLCPKVPILVAQDGGRFGNQIWEYAAVWGLAQMLDRPGYAQRSMLTTMGKLFSNLSLSPIEDIAHCSIKLGRSVNRWSLRPIKKVAKKFRKKNLLLEQWTLLPEPVLLYKDRIHAEFQYHPQLLQQVHETVSNVNGQGKVLIGVHVRRTDFAQFLPKYFKASIVGDRFFKDAMEWFRKKIPGPKLFLIVSDDLEWCRNHLLDASDVLIASKSAEHDLALLSSCNHTIIDYGTFGYWGALMAGGHTVSLDVDKNFNKIMAQNNKYWHLFTQNDSKDGGYS